MKTYKITLLDEDKLQKCEEEVQGNPIKFVGFDDFEFFIHSNEVVDKWGVYDRYVISEASSGYMVTSDFTEDNVIQKAERILNKNSPEELMDRINKIKSALESMPNTTIKS